MVPIEEDTLQISRVDKNWRALNCNATAQSAQIVETDLMGTDTTYTRRNVYAVVSTTWSDETMSEDWHESVICLIRKKGDKFCCENFRWISLLRICFKNNG